MDEAEFDRFADEYHRQHAESIRSSGEQPEFFHKYKITDVAAELAAKGSAPRRILDFGGGIGNSLPHMRAAFPQSEIVLLDPSAKSLAIAEERHPEAARFQQFDGQTIPFPDNHFDAAFAACVFHHIPEELQVPLLREIRRVLAPGGDLFIFEHNPYNPLTVQAVRNCPFDENAVLIKSRLMQKRLRAAGLEKQKTVFRLFFPHMLRKLRFFEAYLRWLPLGAQYYIRASAD